MWADNAFNIKKHLIKKPQHQASDALESMIWVIPETSKTQAAASAIGCANPLQRSNVTPTPLLKTPCTSDTVP